MKTIYKIHNECSVGKVLIVEKRNERYYFTKNEIMLLVMFAFTV